MPSEHTKSGVSVSDSHRVKRSGLSKPDPILKESSKQCIDNLLKYRPHAPTTKFPRNHTAAVLVALFSGRAGDLYVILSRRSAALRTYAGDTSLPGGKFEFQDRTLEDTARREAFEEIGLPQDKEKVPLLCILEPFLAGNKIIVTPVVVLILDKTLQPVLNESEVTCIFSHPLAAFLSSKPPFPHLSELSEPYHTYEDYQWSKTTATRMHRFLTGREANGIRPVFGLTAAILIRVAQIGYAQSPAFEVHPPGAPTTTERIAHHVTTPSSLRDAYLAEGLDPDLAARRLLYPPLQSTLRNWNSETRAELVRAGVEWSWMLPVVLGGGGSWGSAREVKRADGASRTMKIDERGLPQEREQRKRDAKL